MPSAVCVLALTAPVPVSLVQMTVLQIAGGGSAREAGRRRNQWLLVSSTRLQSWTWTATRLMRLDTHTAQRGTCVHALSLPTAMFIFLYTCIVNYKPQKERERERERARERERERESELRCF